MNIENNKIIAEFMGMKPHDINELDGFWTNTIKAHKFDSVMNMQFDSDWNWLMEVVAKIESLEIIDRMGRFNVNTKNFDENYTSFITVNDNEFIQCEGESKKEAIYNACIEFIEWYNKRNTIKTEWVCTDLDNEQYGKQIDTRTFDFKEKNRGLGEYEVDEFIEIRINLDSYTVKEIDNHISAYYEDINEIKTIYGDDSDWIIAECIFEQESGLY